MWVRHSNSGISFNIISSTTSRPVVRVHFHRVSAKRVLQLLHWCMVCAQAFLSLAAGLHAHEFQKQSPSRGETKICVQESVSNPLSKGMELNWVRKAKSMTSGSHPPNGWIKTLAHPKAVLNLSMKCLIVFHEQEPQYILDGKSEVPSTTFGQYSSRNWQHWHTFTLFSNCCKIWTCPACTLQNHHVLHNPLSNYSLKLYLLYNHYSIIKLHMWM